MSLLHYSHTNIELFGTYDNIILCLQTSTVFSITEWLTSDRWPHFLSCWSVIVNDSFLFLSRYKQLYFSPDTAVFILIFSNNRYFLHSTTVRCLSSGNGNSLFLPRLLLSPQISDVFISRQFFYIKTLAVF